MSRAVTVGLGQRFRSQSKRISSNGEVCCRRSGLGGGPSANENVVSFRFGIGDFLGVFGWAAIERELLVGAEVDGDDNALGIGAGFLITGAGGCAELLRSFNAVARRCAVVAEYGAKHPRGFREDFGG